MAIYKQLAAVVAPQIGVLKGAAESYIKAEALKITDKFINSCPVQEELEKIVKVRNILVNNITKVQKRADKITSIAKILELPIAGAKIYITLLKFDIRQSTIGLPPPEGGVVYSERLGRIREQAAKLAQTENLVDLLEQDVKNIKALSQGVQSSLGSVSGILQSIDVSVLQCAEELGAGEELNKLLQAVQPPENTGSEGTPNENYLYRGANGKDYTLAIIEDTNEPGPIPRRVAVAKDRIGVIVLRGQPSFSSDTQVLLDELKFRIDNQLP